tara:strand:- start:90 stop:386 length:297 start_codon:yes stop_codon:yes gene_type:complete
MTDWIKKTIDDGVVTYINPEFEKILDGTESSPTPTLNSDAPKPDATEIALDLKRVKAHEAKRYLAETDWYASRKAETGKAIPDDVLAKRVQARIDAEG